MVARPVALLVMSRGGRGQGREGRRAAEHLLGEHRVKLDPVELRARERAGLVPDRVRHRTRAEVVHECRSAKRGRVLFGKPEDAGGIRRELCAAAAMPAPVRRLEIDEVGCHLERMVESLARQHAPGLGLERQDGIPRLRLVESLEPGGAVLEEEVGEPGS